MIEILGEIRIIDSPLCRNAHPAADHVRVFADERSEEARSLLPTPDPDGGDEKPEPGELAVHFRARESLNVDFEGATGQFEEFFRIDGSSGQTRAAAEFIDEGSAVFWFDDPVSSPPRNSLRDLVTVVGCEGLR